MKKLKLVLFLIALFCFGKQSECYAKNYYALSAYEVTKVGKAIRMNIATKTFDEKACNATVNLNEKRVGEWTLMSSDCYAGAEYDENLKPIFNNEDIGGAYLSYVNLSGYETRINFVGVAGENSPLPGFPIVIPIDQIMPLINNMKQSIESLGIKDIKIIYLKK